MVPSTFAPEMMLAILPEIGLLLLAGVILVLDLIWHGEHTRRLGLITVVGLALVAVLGFLFSWPGSAAVLLFGGMLRLDQSGFVFRLIFVTGAALTALFAHDTEGLSRGEFYILLVVSTLGMSLMASAADLVMLFLAIETTSIPLYVMAGFLIRSDQSAEAGIKYLLFGAMSSAIMLYGFSLLYGFTGTTQLYQLAAALKTGNLPMFLMVGVAMLVLAGFSFKVSAVPFHFWAPDVYEGAPTPVAGFLSTASKAAGFAVLLRVLLTAFPFETVPYWSFIVAMLSVASMTVGNLLALAQKNVKRLLAYSSIAQAGYILIGVAADNSFGTSGAIYYLMGYLVTNLAAFGIVSVMGRAVGSDEIFAYRGMARRSPALGLIFLAALLSLGGIPPFAGFFGKLLVFGAAVKAQMVWLAVVGVLNSIVALYYYLTLLKVVWGGSPEDEHPPIVMPAGWVAALAICMVGILVLGVIFSPFYTASTGAASALFLH